MFSIPENQSINNNEQPIKLSISHNFINKNPLTNPPAWKTFQATSMTEQALMEHITSGKAISPAFLAFNHRIKHNFISATIMGLDFDDDGLEKMMQDEFISQYAFLCIPTPSSTPEAPRCRVYFILDEAIDDAARYTNLLKRLLLCYPKADPNCKDEARMYFGSNQPGFVHQQGKRLPIAVLEALPEPPSRRNKSKSSTVKSAVPLVLTEAELSKLERDIRCALRYIQKRSDYATWLKVVMAVWDVLPNKRGIALIEEWSSGYEGEVAEKFASFDRDREDRISVHTLWYMARQNGWTENITIVPDLLINQRFLNEAGLAVKGATLVRSDMNTGKTRWVEEEVRRLERKAGRKLRVLVITHRKALIENLFKRFGYTSYDGLSPDELREAEKLICTPNSLRKLVESGMDLPEYDVIIIDEIEQVLIHLTGKTFKLGEAAHAHQLMNVLLRRATNVIGLDAHAGETAYHFFKEVRDDVRFIVNTYRNKHGQLKLIGDEDSWLTCLLDRIEHANNTIVVACDRKKSVKYLAKLLKKHGIHNIKIIHSDNSGSREIQEFIADINNELSKYKVVLYSPTIGTGVDIQAEVDSVFGYFKGGTLTAEEQHQMLARCRKADTFFVYLNQIKYDLTTDADAIYKRHFDNFIRTCEFCDIDPNGKPEINAKQKSYLRFASRVVAVRNASMNEAHYRFMLLAESNYEVEEIMYAADNVLEQLKSIREELAEQKKDLILTANPIDPKTYEAHTTTGEITEEIEAGYMRWLIEDTFGETVSSELLEMWENGRFRHYLLQFIDLHRTREEMITLDHQQHNEDVEWMLRHHHVQRWDTFHHLLTVIFESDFHLDEISEEDLYSKLEGDFKEQAEKHKVVIYNVMGRKKPKEKEDISFNILRWLLKHIGLRLDVKREGKKHDGKKKYKLDAIRFTEVRTFALSYIQRKNLSVNMDKPVFGEKD